jgi:hypothetical protein
VLFRSYNFLRNPETGAVSVIDLNTLPGSGAARAFTEGNRIGQNPATIIKQNWNLKPRLRSTKGVDDLGPYTERGGNKFYDLEGGYTDELSKLSDEEFAKYVSGLSDAEKLALYGLESERRTPYVVNELKKPINELIDTRSKAVTLPITTQERINAYLNYITNPIKQNKQGGPLVNNNGYKDGRPPKGSNWRIAGDTVYNPTGETILAKANTGEQAILQPYDKSSVTFQDADYIDEYHLTSKTDNWLDDYKAKLGGPYNSSWMLTNPKPKPVMMPQEEDGGWLYQYKKGGQYGGLDRWFAEKWVDIKSGKPCGRQEGESRAYPACRPSKRVSSKTPKTSSELSSEERSKFKSSKTSSQRIPYSHNRRK